MFDGGIESDLNRHYDNWERNAMTEGITHYYGIWNERSEVWAMDVNGYLIYYPSSGLAYAHYISIFSGGDLEVREIGPNGYPVQPTD
jgi:hypothetical protein